MPAPSRALAILAILAMAACESRSLTLQSVISIGDGTAIAQWRVSDSDSEYYDVRISRLGPDGVRWMVRPSAEPSIYRPHLGLELHGDMLVVRELARFDDGTREVRLEAFAVDDGRRLWRTTLARSAASRSAGDTPITSVAHAGVLYEHLWVPGEAESLARIDRATGDVQEPRTPVDVTARVQPTAGGVLVHDLPNVLVLNDDGRISRLTNVFHPGCASATEYAWFRNVVGRERGEPAVELVVSRVDALGDARLVPVRLPAARADFGCSFYEDRIIVTVHYMFGDRIDLLRVARDGSVEATRTFTGVRFGPEVGNFPLAASHGTRITRFVPYIHRLQGLDARIVVVDHETLDVAWWAPIRHATSYQVDGTWYITAPGRLVAIDGMTGAFLGAVVGAEEISPGHVRGGHVWMVRRHSNSITRLDARTLWPTFVSGPPLVALDAEWPKAIQPGGTLPAPASEAASKPSQPNRTRSDSPTAGVPLTEPQCREERR